MTTYQGRRYVTQQLDSVLAQTRVPDLVVVADDASTDGTVDLVRAALRATTIPIRILTAPSNAGLRANVESGLRACAPGIVALADHDDLWRPDKLALIEAAFADPSVVLWFSDADLVDSDGVPLGVRAWDAVRFDEAAQRAVREGRAVDRFLHGMTVVGATMAFRTELLSWALPLPVELDAADHLFLHDGWLAVLGSVVGRVHAEPRPLVRYRQHGGQLTAMSMLRSMGSPDADTSSVDNLRIDQARTRLVADRLREVGLPPHGPPGVASDVFRRDAFLTDRLALRDRRSGSARVDAALVVRRLLAGDYHRYARGVLTAGKDLGLAMSRPRPR
jgi:glycosyltransferase involved in cell wall biosynthesis